LARRRCPRPSEASREPANQVSHGVRYSEVGWRGPGYSRATNAHLYFYGPEPVLACTYKEGGSSPYGAGAPTFLGVKAGGGACGLQEVLAFKNQGGVWYLIWAGTEFGLFLYFGRTGARLGPLEHSFTLSFVCRGLRPELDPELAIKAVNTPPGTLELRSQTGRKG